MTERAEVDETARLILMDNPPSILVFAAQMREHYDLHARELGDLWGKYRGFDRGFPTHDIETGRPLCARPLRPPASRSPSP